MRDTPASPLAQAPNLDHQAYAPFAHKILVVDDVDDLRRLLTIHVRALGCEPIQAASGEEALEVFQNQAPDVVLMDVRMPGMDGLEATRRIKALAGEKWVPVILVSGQTDDDDVSDGLTAGADDYLYKPVRPVLFKAKMNAVLRSLYLRKERETLLRRLRIGASVFESTQDGVMITDAGNNIIDVNPAFSEITDYSRSQVLGRNPRFLASGMTPLPVYQDLWRTLHEHDCWRGTLLNRRKNGQVHQESMSISVIRDEASPLNLHHVCVVSRFNPQRDDTVTGLPKRQLLTEKLTQIILQARYGGNSGALVLVGLDRFKEINAAMGFATGDLLLRETAQRLHQCLGPDDALFRIGGDEFGIVLTNLPHEESVSELAEAVLQATALPYPLAGQTVHSTASIGIALCPEDGDSAERLLSGADMAMQAAKKQGGHRLEFVQPTRLQAAQAHKQLVDDLRCAIAEEQFSLVFQPICQLNTGRIRKAEALIRWNHPQRGLVHPMQFIEAAERSGLILEIGEWVWQQGLTALQQLRQRHSDFQLSINISPRQILDSGFDIRRYVQHLQGADVPGSAVVLEFTESLLLDSNELVMQRLAEFRQAGIQMAIDDFGTGYSSLAYLDRFDFQFLKIDQSFVRAPASDRKKQALCEAIIKMGHTLGLQVIAEGMETEEQRRFLTEQDCDFGQGYLLARPGSLEDLKALLDQAD